ncbi:aspartyl/asparaginyl beta-hydroxylase domain-containing protein [Solimonas sp. K1W22B-7]|uniref:aspartyl/asparaginyl beta-hydroxylase domain-containing protein n=1 Tax=Solimonas sp. K1W22B-7 TaxID=2303331 RepID=UPI0019692F97|nr:aspartyl/asparaginyl beta-hydroxylase domain-containing protein [Solimonas sp. K1W22B-7]
MTGTPARRRLAPPASLARDEWPDRLRLPLRFDPARLAGELAALEARAWIDHFVSDHYQGRWCAIPLRIPAGTERQHPILQISSHPGTTAYVDAPLLDRLPAFQEVLRGLGFPLAAARLMRLDPGAVVKPHSDPDLDGQGHARIHIPVRTNPGVRFVLNGTPVVMRAGECWYLRLSDTHSLHNDGSEARVHLVVDAPVGPELRALMVRAQSLPEHQRS